MRGIDLQHYPTDEEFDIMAPQLIDESLLLAVQLGIDASFWIEKKEERHKIAHINRMVLQRWREDHPGKPKMEDLAQALCNIGINIEILFSDI